MIELLQPIIDKLAVEFGDSIPIYTEKQEQGVETPCFFVRLTSAELVGQFDNRYYFNNFVTVVYMHDKEDLYELEKIRFMMLAILEDIQTKKGVHGQNLSARIQDKDVIFTADYNLWLEKVKIPDPLMKILTQEQHVGGSE